jgi:Ca2+ transporting ATPase
MENAYNKTPAEALRHFQVDEHKGLSASQVQSAREKHGKNGMWEPWERQTTANTRNSVA